MQRIEDGGPMTAARDAIRARAEGLGFDAVGFARAGGPTERTEKRSAALAAFIGDGHHGDMGWMARRMTERASPEGLWPGVRSVVALALNYGPGDDPRAHIDRPERGVISAYARGRDYHKVAKSRLKALGRWIAETYATEIKVFVDTAPVMEKPLAQQAGLGWQGKHTNLVSRRFGSWLFLGEVFTALDLAEDAAERDHCGGCRACLDSCPTNAFPAPYRLDARRCISYLTIEHHGHIAREFRKPIGNRIYGCDDCLAACPWNKFAQATREHAFLPRIELTAPRLADFVMLDDAAFRHVFSGSPIKRVGRDRFIRNVLIAIGNSGDATLAPLCERLLADSSPLVRAMAVWALSELMPAAAFRRLAASRAPVETDPEVACEWADALSGPSSAGPSSDTAPPTLRVVS